MAMRIKRIYEPPDAGDGVRVLVDRLWPRGVSKEAAKLDLWLKDIAPSPDLRRWFGHDPAKFDEFRARYLRELNGDPEKKAAVAQVLDLAGKGAVTLLYAAKSPTVNHAIILSEYLREQA